MTYNQAKKLKIGDTVSYKSTPFKITVLKDYPDHIDVDGKKFPHIVFNSVLPHNLAKLISPGI